ncbi:arginine/ornithine succinyltransferase subunit alpha [Paraburkholderia bannensis]|uniref:arginine/ornithine succinyltransferase subunit alpha n=1 Tax=Paraburkholderia tropica TaxID=92647 RepID=UPI000F53CDF4|nr:arginine/ornithine succinyltransferase subunit alpha [Paraburkholderia bannensis]RQM49252.1 arginine/ornithine succinyltransferase subunit alpha [Paraburkholderia bannensis]
MLFVRPARLADLDAIAHMARTAQPVLHSLPHDRAALEARIALSEDSFRADVDFPGEEFYLFVLEDSATGRLVGTSSLIAAAGYSEPFYAFRNDALIHASRELHVNRKIHALTMSHELTGKSRLAGFYIDPALRGDAAAHLMSRARMMYVAMNRRRFTPEVFSLLLGVTDDAGASPFWEAVGRKFFGRDFKDIEMASGGRSRTFIAEVMPAYPLYVPLLPEAAQRVLGEPDPRALLAYEIHLEEGFEPDRYVDIFDAGPVLTAQVDRTASVAGNATRVVREGASAGAEVSETYLVASQQGGEFRCVLATLPVQEASTYAPHAPHAPLALVADAPLDAATRAALNVQDGARVRCAPLYRETPDNDNSMGEAQ